MIAGWCIDLGFIWYSTLWQYWTIKVAPPAPAVGLWREEGDCLLLTKDSLTLVWSDAKWKFTVPLRTMRCTGMVIVCYECHVIKTFPSLDCDKCFSGVEQSCSIENQCSSIILTWLMKNETIVTGQIPYCDECTVVVRIYFLDYSRTVQRIDVFANVVSVI